METGRLTCMRSGFYTVQCQSDEVVCRPRGRLKLTVKLGDVMAIGDLVQISRLPDGSGMVENVLPRTHELVRMSPMPRNRGQFRQVMLANPDQMMLVFACAQPAPSLRMLDRFLVICEKQEIPPVIVANKVDLVGIEKAREIFAAYPPLGYRVMFTSVRQGLGVEDLRAALVGRLSGLAGPSGVGKSSLLNAIQPELGLAVREVSIATERGRHTTVVRRLFPLNEGGFVADLPGLRSLALWDTEPEELDGYFPELSPLVELCQFNDCKHQNEPGCAVRLAVQEGRVHPARYQSYLRLRFGGDED
jgi:ribosome biogenesis GTPase